MVTNETTIDTEVISRFIARAAASLGNGLRLDGDHHRARLQFSTEKFEYVLFLDSVGKLFQNNCVCSVLNRKTGTYPDGVPKGMLYDGPITEDLWPRLLEMVVRLEVQTFDRENPLLLFTL
ncbi:MAG: hypothetical protein M0Z85_01330 [Gammaproteobacteria bacterium]|nr:hypothetical protein [Gammaproteobacteria bacterium]